MVHAYKMGSSTANPANQWWGRVSNPYHHFFDYSTRLDTISPSGKTMNLLHDMNVFVEQIADEACPPNVMRARQVLLDAMDAALHGYHAMLKADDSRAARFIQVARQGVAQFEVMMNELGIR